MRKLCENRTIPETFEITHFPKQFRTWSNIYDGVFFVKNNYFHKNALSQMFDRVLNKLLPIISKIILLFQSLLTRKFQ